MKATIPLISTAFLCTCGNLSALQTQTDTPTPLPAVRNSVRQPQAADLDALSAAAGQRHARMSSTPQATDLDADALSAALLSAARKSVRQPYFVDFALGAQSVQFKDGDTQDPTLLGGTISVGGYLSKTRPGLKNLLLTCDVGLFFGDYTDTMLNNTTPYGSGSLLNHEILTRKNTQYSVPAHITLAYELPLGDFRFRIGPTLGFTWVSIKSKFEGGNEISNPLDPSDPNSNGPQNYVSLTKSASEAVFSYGATAGVSWEITNRLRLDLQYRLISNGALDFGDMRNFGTSLSHQATIGLGWRF